MRAIIPFVVILLTPIVVAAQRLTPWGDSDLQGVWTSQTPVPLERPATLGDKAFFSEQEAEEFERGALARLLGLTAAEVAFSGELNGIWLETQNGKVASNRRTSLVVDPIDGRIPYTEEGRKRWSAAPSTERLLTTGPLAANGPEDRTQPERCLTTDGLPIPNPFYNNFHHIIQTQGYVAILTEMMHEVRIIRLDRRPHVGAGIRQWLGDSRGWWEGQTLVVETTNFNDKRLLRGSTQHLRLVERFTRRDDKTIDYRVTVTDSVTFAAPWTIENALRQTGAQMYEVACHEGNYGLAAILSGARAEERRQESSESLDIP
jgi:hypothetical protein